MARPSIPPVLRRWATGGRGVDHADRGDWDRPGENSCSLAALDDKGAVVRRRRLRRTAFHPSPRISHLCGRDGGLLRCPPSRPPTCGTGPPGATDVAGVCSALRQGAEERRSRCRGDRRGGDPTDDAVCRAESRGTARHADAASRPRPPGRRAHGVDQSAPCHPARARDHHPAGSAQAASSSRP